MTATHIVLLAEMTIGKETGLIIVIIEETDQILEIAEGDTVKTADHVQEVRKNEEIGNVEAGAEVLQKTNSNNNEVEAQELLGLIRLQETRTNLKQFSQQLHKSEQLQVHLRKLKTFCSQYIHFHLLSRPKWTASCTLETYLME